MKFENLFNKTDDKKTLSIYATVSTAIFFFVCHGYRAFSLMFSHDALSIFECQPNWQIGIGRFVQPILFSVRGIISLPWLFTVLSVLWIVLSVNLVIDIFDINSYISVLVIAGIMTCNSTLTLSNASYMQWMDIYALALFMSLISAKYLLKKSARLKDYFVSICALVVCLGLYQSYVCVTLGIVLFEYIRKLERIEKISDFFKDAFKKVLVVAIGGVLYFVIWKGLLKIADIPSTNYYGFDDASSSNDMMYALMRTYKNVAIYMRRPFVYSTGADSTNRLVEYIGVLANILIIGYLCVVLIIGNLKSKKYLKMSIQIVLMGLLPFALNFACFLTKGDEHSLMQYGISIFYILAIVLWDKGYLINNKSEGAKSIWIKRGILSASFAIVIWINIVFANQVYAKKALQEESARYEMTKLVQEVESIDGYKRGETRVILTGYINDNDYFSSLDKLDMIQGVGIDRTMFSYGRTIGEYVNYVFNANMNFYVEDVNSRMFRVGDDANYEENWIDSEVPYDMIKNLPVYPEEGSVTMINGAVVIRLSGTDTIW